MHYVSWCESCSLFANVGITADGRDYWCKKGQHVIQYDDASPFMSLRSARALNKVNRHLRSAYPV